MRPKILIVEDEITLAKDLARSLKTAGYEITGRVSSAEEAIRTVEESKPDVVLMGINLQGEMDGIEAAESIRKRYDVPVVYLTGFAADDVLERAKKTEPYGYLGKPVSSIELKSTIDTTLYRHEADRRVRASEHELRLVTDSLVALLAHVNSEQRYVWANRAYRRFFGLSSSEIKGRHVRDVLGDKTYSRIRHCIERALSGEKVSFETPIYDESGQVKHIFATYVPHTKPDGTVEGFILQAVDITDRKKAEEALRQSERRYRQMFQRNEAVKLLIDPESGDIVDANAAASAFYGYAVDELKQSNITNINTLPRRHVFEEMARAKSEEKKHFLVPHRLASGEIRDVEVYSGPVDTPERTLLYSIIHDITARKKAEEELRESEALFRTTFDNASVGVCLVGTDGKFLRVNRTMCQLLGYTEKELCQMGFNDITHEDDHDIGTTFVNRAVSGDVDTTSFEKRYIHKSGDVVWAQVSSTLFRKPTGEPRYFITHVQDVTDRRKAVDALRDRETRFRAYFELPLIGIAITSPEKTWVDVNDKLCQILGYSRDELIGLTWPELTHPDDLDEDVTVFDKVLSGETEGYFIEKRYVPPGGIKKGEVIWAEVSARCLRRPDGSVEYFVVLVQDITERKKMEMERLAYLRFLESMERVDRAMRGASNLEQMMTDVLDTVLSIFHCDRAWLVYPCDPEAASWWAPMERTRPEYPGAFDLGISIPMTEDVAWNFRTVLSSDGPVEFGPGSENPLPKDVAERFGFQSFVGMAVHPRVGKPWEFGLHQCSYPRVWTSEEKRLLREIGRRLTDGLSVLLAHRDLQESERRYREIFENTSDAIFLLDVTLDGGFVFSGLSPAGERMTGLLNQEITGKFVEDMVPEKIAIQFIVNCRQCVESGIVMDYEEELDSPSGRRWAHTTLIPVRDVSGRVYRIVVVSRDITATRLAELELQRSNDLLRAIIEAAPTAIIGLDLDGNVQNVWNPAAEKMLGWSAHEVMGRPLPSVPVAKQEEFQGFRERIRSGMTLDGVEVSRLRRDGKPIDYSIYSSPLHDTEGHIKGNIAVLVDITERKKSETLLKARLALSEYAHTHTLDELLQRTLDIAELLTESEIGFFHFLEADQKTLSLQMWSTNTLEKMCTAEGKGSHYPIDQAGVWVDCVYQGGPVIHNDYEALPHRKGMPTGHARVSRELVVPVFQGDAIVAILGVGNKRSEYGEDDIEAVSQLAEMAWDIVMRKKAEEALRRRDEFLTTILESLTHPFYIVNADDYTIEMSNRAAFASGLAEGATCYSAAHGETVPCGDALHPCPIEILKSTGQPTMVDHVHRDAEGRLRNIEVHAYPIPDSEGRVKQIIEYCVDVTDRTQAQQALLESERTLKTILSMSPSGISYFRDGKLTWANRTMMNLFGYGEDEQDELFGTSIQRFFESEDEYERVREVLLTDLEEGRAAEAEARFRRKDGSIFVGSMAASAPISDHLGQGTTFVISDITTRKAAEEERARLVTVIEQSAESIVVTDREGTIQYVNPAFEKLTGYTAREAEGQNPRILKSGSHGAEFYRKMWETLTSGESWRGHLVNKKKDGSLFEEEATISPVKDEARNIVNYVAVKRDVTDRVLLEKQLQQAQKMESIGTLAAGIAHDFNNLLQVVLGYSEILIMDRSQRLQAIKNLEIIRKAAKDGGELIKGLLTFSRQVESKLRPTDMNLELNRIRGMLRRTIPRMIEIEFRPGDSLSAVNADPVQVQQVLLNLCVNAHHAMPEGGKLTIETGNVSLDKDYCKNYLNLEPGEYVRMKISDNGHGMERELVDHIFEPFYTTKKAGEGTGLGLSVVYGIVKNHAGHIVCESEPGRGTTFEIYFPALVSRAEPSVALTAGELPGFGSETILLVDDEYPIRRMAKQLLAHSGYEVLEAGNGVEALRIYREKGDEIDLVVLDLIMPEMGGEQCLQEILKIDPKAKVLVASGYLVHSHSKEVLKSKASGVINKPFEVREFLRVVRKTLDETGL